MTRNRRVQFRTGLLDKLFVGANYAFNLAFTFACFYPFYYLILVSLSDSNAVYRGEVIFWPINATVQYFKDVFEYRGILQSFCVSVARTVLGTVITLFFTCMLGYVLTKRELKWRKIFYRLTIFTMYANAGLIPWVVTYSMLGLRNNFLVYILPSAVSAFGVVLVKTFIEQMPQAVEEAAIMDGAGYFMIYTRIIVPLAKPVIAALAVFSAVSQWNSFQDNFFLVQSSSLRTMQMMLYTVLRAAESIAMEARAGQLSAVRLAAPPDPFTVRCTVAVITMIPIILVYPFLQKYFVKGIMLGAVKG